MKAQQLKNAILQLAIQGKLVPQDPNDEPASVLLEKIQQEKQKLIEEGKIKKSKKSTSELSTYTEPPFDIPDSWEWVRFGSILSVSSGQNLKKSQMTNGNYPVYGGNGINGYYDDYLVEKNTIIIGRVGFYCGTAHKTYKKSWVTDNALIVEQIHQCFIPEFLLYLLNYFDLKKTSVATAQPVISGERIYKIFIPLLSLNEQKRIVAKIEELLPFVEQYAKKAQELTALYQNFPEQLKKSILQSAIQGKLTEQNPHDEPASLLVERIQSEKERLIAEKKIKKPKQSSRIIRRDNSHYEIVDGIERCIDDELPFDIPENWCWVRLRDIVFNLGQKIPTEDFFYIDVGSIDNKENKLSNVLNIIKTENAPSRARKIVKKGTILYSTVRPYLKNICIIEHDFEYPAIASTAFAAINTFAQIYNKYLFYYLLSPVFTGFVNSEMIGVAYPAINDDKLYNLVVPIPPLSEQKRIVEKVESLLSILQNLERN
ncbi:TPA: restriction endonuclease subunit S [Pasteurella multocida]|nr:restriction endonuclease subunit S [Pasteurella multocida]